MSICIDLDDFTDEKLPLLTPVLKLKELKPNLKITMFCIPKGCSDKVLQKVKDYGFFELVQHGVKHSLYECKNLFYSQTKEMFEKWANPIFAKGFKCPNWLGSHAIFKVCREMDYWLAIHPKQLEMAKRMDVKYYLFTQTIIHDWKPINGHIRATGHVCKTVCGDSIEESWKNLLKLPPDGDFKFISEMVENDFRNTI
jgi:hypothetical protein